MLFPNFRLLIWALGLERAQENLSKFQVINTIQPQTLPCELACKELSLNVNTPILFNDDAKLEMWSLFQRETKPQCTIRPRVPEDVSEILAIARDRRCRFAVLGGGTSPFKGASNIEGGITIDMSLMNNLNFDPDSGLITVGGGSLWADVYRFLDPRNLSSAGTRNSLTGVAGSVLGGGISFFSQKHGWACDNVHSFDLVLANSSLIHISHATHPDLFWALRGGGNNLGVISSLTLNTFHQPQSYYTFQRWHITMLEAVFRRLESITMEMPRDFEMIATTLGWHVPSNQFVISERTVASEQPKLPQKLPVLISMQLTDGVVPDVLDERIYTAKALVMSQKMDRMNAAGFFNYFGSVTVKNNARLFMTIAAIFQDEVQSIKGVAGLQVYIVYNPLTVSTIEKMERHGGNALGIRPKDGPLNIVNINLHWIDDQDTAKMKEFMRRLIDRFKEAAEATGMLHPYLFQNHAFEEQDVFAGYGEENHARLKRVRQDFDPDGVFTHLQPGYHKL